MNELELFTPKKKTITTKELAESLGVDKSTVTRTLDKMPDLVASLQQVQINGKTGYVFNEAQATAVKIALQNKTKVAKNGFNTLTVSNDLEGELLVQRAMAYQSQKIAELQRRAEIAESALDRIANGKGCYSNSQAAKALQLPYGRNTFIAKLKEKRIYMGSGEPYQDQVNAGHFVVKNKVCSDGTNRPVSLVTGKGLVYLSKQFGWKIDGAVAPDAE